MLAATDDLDRAIARKVAGRLAPLLMVCYFVAFLDRVNVSLAALTMNADLGFDSAIFGLGAGIFFLGYFIFEVPSNLILEKVGARVWIARIMFSWGLVSTAMALVWNEPSFYVARFLLGAAAAGLLAGAPRWRAQIPARRSAVERPRAGAGRALSRPRHRPLRGHVLAAANRERFWRPEQPPGQLHRGAADARRRHRDGGVDAPFGRDA